jgi:hypothetical protein
VVGKALAECVAILIAQKSRNLKGKLDIPKKSERPPRRSLNVLKSSRFASENI